ncbi:MAG TPA: S41 family peptidase [Candidatus Saccharimonadales bacterium]|nr:S41 family peptidase [Candidatus Saccharimonadales bacterium]
MLFRQKSGRGEFLGKRSGWPKISRSLVIILLAVLIFNLGVAVGNGRLSFNRPIVVSGNLPDKLDYSSINQVYKSLRDNYDGKLNESDLLDGLKHGLAEASHDPYTVYFTAKEAKKFEEQLNNSFSGIGAELGKDKDDNLIVVAPIAGFPAEKVGLKAQDIIVSIDGQTTSSLSIDEAISKIRGPAGSQVKLQIVRSHSEQLPFTITRQNIQIPSVKTKILDGNIGYIQIVTFAEDTNQLMQQAAAKMADAKVKGIVLDLRGDPGGLLDAAVNVSSEWLPKGKLVLQEKRGPVVVNSYSASGDNPLNGIPTVVLINEGSASASEITAGALHDNGAAYLIGVKSYGKGVVQQIVNFHDGSELKVTVASWFRPNGQNINKKGITPDQIVKLTDDDAKVGNDTQLKAAEDYLNK